MLFYVSIIRFKLQVSSWTVLSSKSWVKLKIPRLLEHETGHYILGCLCALDFKVRYYLLLIL
jgi:hypothetical protein